LDRPRRADVDAGMAALDPVAPVRAQLLAITEELRLLELADHRGQLQRLLGPRRLVAPGMEIALRGLVAVETRAAAGGQRAAIADLALRGELAIEHRLLAKVEHQVELLAALALVAREVDRADLPARRHAGAMRSATQRVDLEIRADRPFRAGVDAGPASHACV